MIPRGAATRLSFLLVLPIFTLFAPISCTPPAEQNSQWEFLEGPYAREITALLPLQQAPGRLLAGMANGDIFFSPSNGQTWIRRPPAAHGMTVHAFVQHPDSPASIYACTAGGLLLSRDEARSWHRLHVADTVRPLSVRCLAFDPWKTQTQYAGTDGNGIYRSTDNGSTWAPANGNPDSLLRGAEVYEIRIDPDRPDRMLAAVGTGGLVITENRAGQWRYLVDGKGAVAAAVTHVLMQRGDGSTIVYGTDAGSVYRSSNLGAFWSPSRGATSGDNIRSLVSVPSHPRSLIAGTENGVIASTDFGESWQSNTQSLPSAGISLVLGPEKPPTWYAFGPAIGLQTSSNEGRTWASIDEHLGGTFASLVASNPSTHDVYVSSGPTLLKTTPGTARWSPATSGLTGGNISSFAFDRHHPLSMFATTALGAFSSEDGGNTWHPFARPLAAPPTELIAHPWFSSRFLASTPNGNYYSTDQGSTWRECRAFSKVPAARSFTFRPTDAGAVYAGAGARGVLLSSDGGISWDVTRYGIDQDTIEFVSLDNNDRNVCYAWTSQARCYRSLNGGLEWGRFTPPWETGDRILLALDRLSPSDIVALANGRTFYVSTDGGTTWMRILERRLPFTPISIAWDHQAGHLLAGTAHGGVYRIELATLLKGGGRNQDLSSE
jgi:photosystem II stability/assembly factor-like uncharacterized protein